MSGYQHYEFQALDRPLTREELAYVRSLSSWVELTPTRAVFVYDAGEFRADPQQMVERCFDAMLYQASFGVQQLMFRMPRSLVDTTLFLPYCVPDSLSIIPTSAYVLINIEIIEEEGLGWIREEDWLNKLVPLRDDLLRGDLRLLYLAWLIAAQLSAEGEDETLMEPPVPPNLGNLSPALAAFVDLFGLDEDLISAAAAASPIEEEEHEPIETWVAELPEAERQDFLVRLARGEAHVGSQLLRRLRQRNRQSKLHLQSDQERRSLADLITLALSKEKNRKTLEQQISRQLRIAQIESLIAKEEEMWQNVIRLIELKQPRAYDQAIEYLIDLKDIAEHQDNLAKFQGRLQKVQADYGHISAFLTKLQQARLY